MRPIVIILLVIFSFFQSYSQNTFSGRIIEKDTQNPVSFAEVLLNKNQTLYKVIIADIDGYFTSNEIADGSYSISISYLGFEPYEESISFSNNQDIKKNIALVSTSEVLDEVTITAKKTTIDFLSDKRVVNVGDDLISIGAGTEDILRQIPSVDVDLAGNVSLRNDTNVIIMIDGKRSPLSSADIIAQIPANLINKIEVITNPSAKYDAEGISGLINIITKKNKLRGANLNLSTGYGENGRANFTTSGNYRNEKINFFANYNFRKNYSESDVETVRLDDNTVLRQNGSNAFKNALINYVKVGVDFFIDSTQTLTPSFTFNQNKHTLTENTLATLSFDDNSPTNNIDFLSENEHTHITREGNLNYRKEFNGISRFFEVDANLALYPNEIQLDLEQIESNGQSFQIDDNQIRDNLITTLSADYYSNGNDKDIYEFGIKYEYRNLDNYQDRVVQTNMDRQSINDNFLYKDQVFAFYGVYEHRFKNFSIKPGIRIEQYAIDLTSYDLNNFENNYLNLFPSFSASYKLNQSNFTTSYTRRISRPNVFVLNPFTIEQGNFERRRGNPFLKPSFADKIELNYNQQLNKNNLNLSLFYSKSEDIIQPIFLQEGDFIVSSFENIGSSEQYGAEVFVKLVMADWWDSNLSFNYYFSEFDTVNFANTTTFSQRYFIRNSFRFLKTWSAQLNSNINPKRQTLQQVIETNYRFDLSLSKKLFKGKGEATLRVNDVFNTQEFQFERSVLDIDQTTIRKPLSRFVYFSYRHSFSFGKNDFRNRRRKNRDYDKGNVD